MQSDNAPDVARRPVFRFNGTLTTTPMSDYRLSDFTPAGWILILTFLPVALGLGFVFAKLWFAMGFRKITNGIFALPGIAYMGLYWAVCRKLGIRLVKDRR